MILKMIKSKIGIVNRSKGDVITYIPWEYTFQGLSEPERVKNGIFVICYGHGEFEILRSEEDVKIIKDHQRQENIMENTNQNLVTTNPKEHHFSPSVLNSRIIHPSAGKIFSNVEDAKKFNQSFLSKHPEFSQRGKAHYSSLAPKKKQRNIFFACVSVQKKWNGFAWVFRYTLKGKKIITQELGVSSLQNLPSIEICFNILSKKYFPELVQ